MGTNNLEIQICNSVEEAPQYNRDKLNFQAASLDKAVIVCKGTEAGNPTIDLQFTDDAGNKYVAMITAGILENLAAACRGAAQRTG